MRFENVTDLQYAICCHCRLPRARSILGGEDGGGSYLDQILKDQPRFLARDHAGTVTLAEGAPR